MFCDWVFLRSLHDEQVSVLFLQLLISRYMKKNLPWILVGILALVSVFIMMPKNRVSVENPVENVVVRDSVQYVTINARGGYRPKTSTIV